MVKVIELAFNNFKIDDFIYSGILMNDNLSVPDENIL